MPTLYIHEQCEFSTICTTYIGAVYRGKYRREVVAVKEFLTASQAEHTGTTDLNQQPFDPDDDIITSGEALFLFRDLRQEVTVLAQLNHPNIVSLLGVSIRPMCMVIEYAPMGSLFGILDKKVEQFKAVQANRASIILRMPGGVLGHEISTRIALQVSWRGGGRKGRGREGGGVGKSWGKGTSEGGGGNYM